MRHRIAFVAATALALAACSDDPGSSPTGIAPALSLSGDVSTCEPATIRYALASLLTDGGAKAFAIPRFNAGEQAKAAGQPLAARLAYFDVVAHVVDRFQSNETAQPRRFESMQQAVYYTIASIHACAGLDLPTTHEDLRDIVDQIAAGGDVRVVVVQPNVDFAILVPSRQFSFVGEGDFWDEPGLVIVNRLFDSDDFSPGYAEYPPRYRITISPYTAQQNFDDDGDGDNDPGDVVDPPVEVDFTTTADATALVSICPGDPHPEPASELAVLRRAEPFLGAVVTLLPYEDPQLVECADVLPPYNPPVIGESVASRAIRKLRGAGSALWDVLGPAPLYAVDGGIGGRVRLASDYVSAQEIEDVVTVTGGN